MKCRYYSSEKTVRDIGGLLKYYGTRPGVDKAGDAWCMKPATKPQEELIASFLKAKPSCKHLSEYSDYTECSTRASASEFISAVIENYPELLNEKTYLDYIATRPRAERIEGAHGLFSDEGPTIDIQKEADAVRAFQGNVFTVIVSVKREDAERLGYNTAERWRDLARSKIDLIAKEHNILLGSLKWYGAFHNESHHPHMHLMLYSTSQEKRGYIDKNGIDRLRHLFGTEIFRYELAEIYDQQTERRNALNSESIDEFNELCMMVEQGLCTNPKIVKMVTDLSDRLKTVKGKMQYGYLPKSVKAMVDGIVDELEEDEHIKRLYDLWYECKCLIYQTYTDVPPKRLPLSQENAFKPIRNAVIKRAAELALGLADDEPLPQDNTQTSNNTSNTTSGTSSAGNTSSTTTSANHNTQTHTEYKPQILTKVTRLGKDIADTFRDRYQEMVDNPAITVDSKLKREIEAKKKGQNLTM